jgi:hypothetical protein
MGLVLTIERPELSAAVRNWSRSVPWIGDVAVSIAGPVAFAAALLARWNGGGGWPYAVLDVFDGGAFASLAMGTVSGLIAVQLFISSYRYRE